MERFAIEYEKVALQLEEQHDADMKMKIQDCIRMSR